MKPGGCYDSSVPARAEHRHATGRGAKTARRSETWGRDCGRLGVERIRRFYYGPHPEGNTPAESSDRRGSRP